MSPLAFSKVMDPSEPTVDGYGVEPAEREAAHDHAERSDVAHDSSFPSRSGSRSVPRSRPWISKRPFEERCCVQQRPRATAARCNEPWKRTIVTVEGLDSARRVRDSFGNGARERTAGGLPRAPRALASGKAQGLPRIRG